MKILYESYTNPKPIYLLSFVLREKVKSLINALNFIFHDSLDPTIWKKKKNTAMSVCHWPGYNLYRAKRSTSISLHEFFTIFADIPKFSQICIFMAPNSSSGPGNLLPNLPILFALDRLIRSLGGWEPCFVLLPSMAGCIGFGSMDAC